MYLKQSRYKKSGRTYLSIVRGYWDSDCKQSRTKTIGKLGYLDELEKIYDDPIAHFEQIVSDMNLEQEEKNKPIAINLDLTKKFKITTTVCFMVTLLKQNLS